MSTFLATVTLESCSDKNAEKNEDRLTCMLAIADRLAATVVGDCVVLFPGGWFHTGEAPAMGIIETVTSRIQERLAIYPHEMVLCFGIDGLMTPDRYDRDQLGLAVGKSGLLALGRKFHRSKGDIKGGVIPAEDHLVREQGYDRIFTLNGHRFFLAVCYDIKGFTDRRRRITNPGADVVLNFVHFFYMPKEEPNLSAVSDFTRKIVLNASRQWGCPVFTTVTFVRRRITEKYRTGMYWRMGAKRITDCRTDENSLRPIDELGFRCLAAEGEAEIRIYDLDAIRDDINACQYELEDTITKDPGVRNRTLTRTPIRNTEAEKALRAAAAMNGVEDIYITLTEGLTRVFGQDRDDQMTKATFFGPNRIGYPGREAIDLIALFPRNRQTPGSMTIRVYTFALAALYGVNEADVRAALPPSFSEVSVSDPVHLGDRYVTGSLDAKGATHFVTALGVWVSNLSF